MKIKNYFKEYFFGWYAFFITGVAISKFVNESKSLTLGILTYFMFLGAYLILFLLFYFIYFKFKKEIKK